MLARALGNGRLPASVREQVLAAATALPNPPVRDLFEHFLPDAQRVQRLGTAIKPEQILTLKGDMDHGREMFFRTAALQCVNCHRVAGTGSTLGPDLSQIGKKYTPAQLLDKFLNPSKTIDPKYAAYVVETTAGQVHTGVLGARTDREVVLRMAGDKEIRIPAKKVAKLIPQHKSLMPEQQLRDLTAEQAADLIAFLASLK
jgi:putative heme-binding domain-containing protein